MCWKNSDALDNDALPLMLFAHDLYVCLPNVAQLTSFEYPHVQIVFKLGRIEFKQIVKRTISNLFRANPVGDEY
jgi:hypothetical protein